MFDVRLLCIVMFLGMSDDQVYGRLVWTGRPCGTEQRNSTNRLELNRSHVETVHCRQGQKVQLVCKTNNTLARVDFRRANTIVASNRISFDDRYDLRHIYNLWHLEIKAVTRTDAGQYECLINGKLSQLFDLVVFVSPTIVQLISIPIRFHEGNTVFIICESEANPSASTTLQVFDKRTNRLTEVIEGSVHAFRRISKKLDVVVKCHADNEISPPASSSIRLTADYEPVLWITPTFAMKSKDRLFLNCCVDSHPFVDALKWQYLNESGLQSVGNEEEITVLQPTRTDDLFVTCQVLTVTLTYLMEDVNRMFVCSASNYLRTAKRYFSLQDMFRFFGNQTKWTSHKMRPRPKVGQSISDEGLGNNSKRESFSVLINLLSLFILTCVLMWPM